MKKRYSTAKDSRSGLFGHCRIIYSDTGCQRTVILLRKVKSSPGMRETSGCGLFRLLQRYALGKAKYFLLFQSLWGGSLVAPSDIIWAAL